MTATLLAAHLITHIRGVAIVLQTGPVLADGGGAPTDIFGALDKIKAAGDTLFTHFLPIGLTLCGIYFAWGGLHAIAAGGNPILMARARTIWWHSAVGLAGVILATPLVNTIHNLFG